MDYLSTVLLASAVMVCSIGAKQRLTLGIDNISHKLVAQYLPALSPTSRFGLVTNHTGKNRFNQRTVDLLLKKSFCISYLFTPEHGFYGTAEAECALADEIDPATRIPIISLYAKGNCKPIAPEIMEKVDGLIVDLQDSGMRHYTYISTLLQMLEIASQSGKPIIVLDRPNPLGGVMEGPLVEADLQSFIAVAPIPLRHGMTIGELARYFNTYLLKKKAQLVVIEMHYYDRNAIPSDMVPMPLSPNIRSLEACFGYSFLGIMGEVRPFDVGIGSPMAFRVILLPAQQTISEYSWQQLAVLLKLWGVETKPYSYFSSRKKQRYVGLQLEIQKIEQFPAFTVLLTVLDFFSKEGVAISYSPAFDRAVGERGVQKMVKKEAAKEHIKQEINRQLIHFFNGAQSSFIYKPFPVTVMVQ